MLAQLATASGGLERVEIIDLLFSLAHLWEQDPCVPEYLNALMDAQKKSVHAGLPFSDDLLIAIGSSSLLKANSFPKDRATWDGKDPAEKTLKAFEEFSPPSTREWSASAASTAIRGHGIKSRPTAMAGEAGALGPDNSFMAQFDANFTALSTAAAGSNVVK